MGDRRRLDDTRVGVNRRVVIGSSKVYIRTGEFEDGSLGEVFISVDREGAELRVYDVLAIMISIGLQHGVPLAVIVDKLKGQQMEPAGLTNDPDVPIARSISDYLGRWLERRYLDD